MKLVPPLKYRFPEAQSVKVLGTLNKSSPQFLSVNTCLKSE